MDYVSRAGSIMYAASRWAFYVCYFITIMTAFRMNVGQAEALQISYPSSLHSNDIQEISMTASNAPKSREFLLSEVVEPGRLLNIFLGAVLIVSFLVINSMIVISLGLAGSVPQTQVRNPEQTDDMLIAQSISTISPSLAE